MKIGLLGLGFENDRKRKTKKIFARLSSMFSSSYKNKTSIAWLSPCLGSSDSLLLYNRWVLARATCLFRKFLFRVLKVFSHAHSLSNLLINTKIHLNVIFKVDHWEHFIWDNTIIFLLSTFILWNYFVEKNIDFIIQIPNCSFHHICQSCWRSREVRLEFQSVRNAVFFVDPRE